MKQKQFTIRLNQASVFGFLAFVMGFFVTLLTSWVAEDLNIVASLAVGGGVAAFINVVLAFTEVEDDE